MFSGIDREFYTESLPQNVRYKLAQLVHPALDANVLISVFVEVFYTRKHLVKFDNDATSCYDRILVLLASILSQKFGMPKNVTLVMARTLEEA